MKENGRPFALMLKKGIIDARGLESKAPSRSVTRLTSVGARQVALDVDQVLKTIGEAAWKAEAAVFATTGFTGRALYQVGDRPNQLYMVGSMGCVSAFALGAALARPQRRVIAIDGDGAFLMRMGSLSAVADASPDNLTHVVLDNGVHDSTGAQSTLSHRVDIPTVAMACGYPSVVVVESIDDLEQLLATDPGELRMVYVRTRPRHDRKLPRPTISPPEVANRMRRWLRDEEII